MSNILDLGAVEEKIGEKFKDTALLRTAFTHSSYANERKMKSNENLEFLGDSILNFVIAEYLFNKHTDVKEGQLSSMRSAVVPTKPLAEAIVKMGLDKHIFVSNKTKVTPKICEDLFEAIVAAIFLDQGFAKAKSFILKSLKKSLNINPNDSSNIDYKTKLQELSQKLKLGLPTYSDVLKSGPDHSPIFVRAVSIGDKKYAEGKGASKKVAEQIAAKLAYNILQNK